jgi:hypothetical protein
VKPESREHETDVEDEEKVGVVAVFADARPAPDTREREEQDSERQHR